MLLAVFFVVYQRNQKRNRQELQTAIDGLKKQVDGAKNALAKFTAQKFQENDKSLAELTATLQQMVADVDSALKDHFTTNAELTEKLLKNHTQENAGYWQEVKNEIQQQREKITKIVRDNEDNLRGVCDEARKISGKNTDEIKQIHIEINNCLQKILAEIKAPLDFSE
ncbi:MAG: hypothetical protein LBP75_02750 [Planctomycetota bacterium]|nr:hypothetical protein [Planctomycetota bacterium]